MKLEKGKRYLITKGKCKFTAVYKSKFGGCHWFLETRAHPLSDAELSQAKIEEIPND